MSLLSRRRPAQLERLHLVITVLGDAVGLLIGLSLAYLLRFANAWLPYSQPYEPGEYSALILEMIPLALVVFALGGLYDRSLLLTGDRELRAVVAGCSIAMLTVVVLAFVVAHDFDPISRGFLVLAWLGSCGFVCATRLATRALVTRLRARGLFMRRAIVLGTSDRATALAVQLSKVPRFGLRIVGCVPVRAWDEGANRALALPDPSASVVDQVEQLEVDEVIVVPDGLPDGLLGELVRQLTARTRVDIRLVSGLYELLTTGVRVEHLAGITLVTLNRLRLSGQERVVKRGLDLALLGLLAPLWLPLTVLAAVMVWLDGPGPILYRRRVLGLDGRPFTALKFRTMRVDADAQLARLLASDAAARREFEHSRKLRHDPRITRVGRWLRRASFDELPQFVNVLRGEMSLVGPRMIAPDEVDLYDPWGLNLLTVKPGLTGPWQVMGRGELPYDARVQLSMEYIRNYSLWTDLQILIKTVPAVLSGRGAY